jgi:hypothetical protein
LNSVSTDQGAALLVRANYGAGKSHLLKVIRDMALNAGYAVSLVVANPQEGVRFNRMDTVLGAVCRELEVDHSGNKGLRELFEAFTFASGKRLTPDLQQIRARISHNGTWDHSDYLRSPAVYVALRAWVASQTQSVGDLVQDWFANPGNYRSQRKFLYTELVYDLRNHFRDPRREWQFYADEVFIFHTGGHRQAWDALVDFDLIARASGLRGLVLLFDEFEGVIQNLNRRDHQEEAFLNMFRFFAGERYPGMSYFAVTPDFVNKCKSELLRRGVYDFDYYQFDRLPFFELDPIEREEFLVLAKRIRFVYGVAYDCDATRLLPDMDLTPMVDKLWIVASPERVRRAIQGVVEVLDDRLDGAH